MLALDMIVEKALDIMAVLAKHDRVVCAPIRVLFPLQVLWQRERCPDSCWPSYRKITRVCDSACCCFLLFIACNGCGISRSGPRNYIQMTALTFCGPKNKSQLDQIAEATP